jgi:hypothetical protein
VCQIVISPLPFTFYNAIKLLGRKIVIPNKLFTDFGNVYIISLSMSAGRNISTNSDEEQFCESVKK